MRVLKWPRLLVLCPAIAGAAEPLLATEPSVKVAIIGAGSAGASAAYHLRKYAAAAGLRANITVFEREPYVGGRSHTVNVWGDSAYPVEVGASIFVKVNRNLVTAAEELDLPVVSAGYGPSVPVSPYDLGIWNGQDFVFTEPVGSSWWDTAKLFWKYGLSPLRANNLMKATVDSFLKLYQEPHFPFRSLTRVAQDVELDKVTVLTGRQYLNNAGVSIEFQNDVIQAATRVNYAQNLAGIHGLEAMVSIAASGAQAVRGGNWQIFDGMIKASRASLYLNKTIQSISRSDLGGYDLVTDRSETLSSFDSVIIAGPYQMSNIGLPEGAHVPEEIPYVTLHVTLFTTPYTLSPSRFNVTGTPPHSVLTTLHPSDNQDPFSQYVGKAGFWSISLLRDIIGPDGDPQYLYKIFSPEPVNSAFLYDLFDLKDRHPTSAGIKIDDDITWVYEKVWQSYPYLSPRATFDKLELDRGLWYTGGMDAFITCMETSSLMGMNVARLVVDDLTGVLMSDTSEKVRPGYKSDL